MTILIGLGAQTLYVREIYNLVGKKLTGVVLLDNQKPNLESEMPEVVGHFDDIYGILEKNKICNVIVCTKDNSEKSSIVDHLSSRSITYTNAIHPGSFVSESSDIGKGCIVNAGAVIQPTSVIGNHVMIHSGSIIEHNVNIKDFVNIAPNATLLGHVEIGEYVTIYSGAVILPGIKIGAGSRVGAGAIVREDVPDGTMVAGVPASKI